MAKQRPYTVSGLLVGGLLGAVCRAAVVFAFWLVRNDPPVDEVTVAIIVLVAAVIGFGIGSCASLVASLPMGGRSSTPSVLGLVLGASLGAVAAFGVSYFTWCCLCGMTSGPNVLNNLSPGKAAIPTGSLLYREYWQLYHPLMALTGAIPGAVGGLVSLWVRRKQAAAEGAARRGDEDFPVDRTSDRVE